jgi:FkbM family methyltransferase
MTGKSLLLLVRIKFLKKLLNLAGFKEVSGHWIYYPPINGDSFIIDLGANKAEFSKQLFKNYNARCYAIEPNQDLINEITDPNIRKFKYAVTKQNSLINFYINDNHEASSVIENFYSYSDNKRVDIIEGITWDSLIEKLGLKYENVSIVKVDIEGSELDLIESFTMENVFLINQFTIEFHDWLNVSLHERTLNAIDKLTSLGFIAISNSPDHSWPVEMLFLNMKHIRFNMFQKVLLNIYSKFTFLKY